MTRVLKRPPNGWDRQPNARLGDWIMFVALMFGGACFFNWTAAAINELISALN